MSLRAVLNALERTGRLVEDVLTVGLLGLMITLASLQIVLRNILDFGFIWGDEFLRIMVLWVAMVGAVAASRADRHISIDVLSRFLPDRVNALVKALTDVFTASVCGLAAYYSWSFVAMEIEFESMILGGVPAWPFQAVLPIGFALISWRYILHAVKSVTRTVAPSLEGGDMIALGIAFALLALLGAPLFAIIAAGAMLSFHMADIDPSVMAIEVFRLAEMPVLLAIPLFTFAGYLVSESGAPGRLVRLSRALLGWMPGGLAVVSLASCAFFTAFTGASGVTIIALGAVLYPALTEAGYDDSFNLGLITTSGSLGLLFAPSLPLILYGIVAQQSGTGEAVSIDTLFQAGILPGILMLVLLSLWSLWVNRYNRSSFKSFSWSKVRAAVREALWEIPLPIVVLGGIYSGFFAVSEAAAVTAVYVIVVEIFILREVQLRDLPEIMRKAMLLVGGVLIILGVSMASTTAMIDAGVPTRLFDFVRSHINSQLTFLVLLNCFLLGLGAILDIFSALVLIVPLILPVAAGYGIHPAHLGIIFLANMQIGYITPPIGMNLFIASYRFEKPVLTLYRATLPFFSILLLSVVVITYWPDLSLWLIQ